MSYSRNVRQTLKKTIFQLKIWEFPGLNPISKNGKLEILKIVNKFGKHWEQYTQSTALKLDDVGSVLVQNNCFPT